MLLPGDIEAQREWALAQYWGEGLYSDWLLVAHHGSQTSSSATFLKYVSPATGVVSSGYANRFGHPHPGVIRRLARLGARILDTSTGGALEFSIAPGKRLRVIAYRRRTRHYWM
jgi:competence protein ComEC